MRSLSVFFFVWLHFNANQYKRRVSKVLTVANRCFGPLQVLLTHDCGITSHVRVAVATPVGDGGVDKGEVAFPGLNPSVKDQGRRATSGHLCWNTCEGDHYLRLMHSGAGMIENQPVWS